MLNVLLYHVLPAVLLVYLGFGAVLFFFQRHYIFYPVGNEFTDCPALADAAQVEYGNTRAYFKETDPGGTLVVLYHGNAETACSRAWYARELYEPLGHSYLLVEYTGFAGDGQKPSAAALYQNAADTAEFLTDKNFSQTVIMAESIGSAPAAYHASLDPSVDALILTSPFISLESVAKRHYPIYPVSLLLRERLETVRWLKDTDAVAHILHGTGDSLVPFSESEAIVRALPDGQTSLTPIDNAGHNDIYVYPQWVQTVRKILDTYAEGVPPTERVPR